MEDEPHAVVNERCDICGAEAVCVVPVAFLEEGRGAECGDCGAMSMYPEDGAGECNDFPDEAYDPAEPEYQDDE